VSYNKEKLLTLYDQGSIPVFGGARVAHRFSFMCFVVVNYWNSLPEKIITSKTLNIFKNRLDKYWEDQNFVHEDFKADIKLEGRDVDFNMSGELDLGAISFHSLSIVQVSWLDFPFIILYTSIMSPLNFR
jgi:hypothetical protein